MTGGERGCGIGFGCVKIYLISFNLFRSSSDHPISLINACNNFAPYVFFGWKCMTTLLPTPLRKARVAPPLHIFFPPVCDKGTD